jgi:hypothetical protein
MCHGPEIFPYRESTFLAYVINRTHCWCGEACEQCLPHASEKIVCDQQENRTPNLQIWNLTRYRLRQPAGKQKVNNADRILVVLSVDLILFGIRYTLYVYAI